MTRSSAERQRRHDVVKALLGDPSKLTTSLRREIAQRLNLVPREDIQKVALAESLEKKQYPRMMKALEKYDVSFRGSPSVEMLRNGLTPHVLGLALQFQNPFLLITPQLTRQKMLRLWNKSHEIHSDLEIAFGWKENVHEQRTWEIDIVEGAENIEIEEEMEKKFNQVKGSKTNIDYVKFLFRENRKQGFHTLSGARRYIALKMRLTDERQTIDKWSSTVLNAPWLTSITPLSLVVCGGDRLSFISVNKDSYSNSGRLHVRRSIPVPFPKVKK